MNSALYNRYTPIPSNINHATDKIKKIFSVSSEPSVVNNDINYRLILIRETLINSIVRGESFGFAQESPVEP